MSAHSLALHAARRRAARAAVAIERRDQERDQPVGEAPRGVDRVDSHVRAQRVEPLEERAHLLLAKVLGRRRLELEHHQLALAGGDHVEVAAHARRGGSGPLATASRGEAAAEAARDVPLQRSTEAARPLDQPVAPARQALDEAEVHGPRRALGGVLRGEEARGFVGGEAIRVLDGAAQEEAEGVAIERRRGEALGGGARGAPDRRGDRGW